MRSRFRLGLAAAALPAAVLLGAGIGTVTGFGTPAAASTGSGPAAVTAPAAASHLASTIALSNCSAALVRYPSSVDTNRALMLTNGHCYEGGMPGPGQVIQNRPSSRTGRLLNASGNTVGTVRAGKVLYATMTSTDVTLYELTDTYASIRSRFGATALTISNTHPTDASTIAIPSGFWRRTWDCSVHGFVATLREANWTWHDSLRYNLGCDTIHGTSGSPVIDTATGKIIGINNTGNDDGGMCTLNNPCEVDQNGNTTARKGQSYGQETYWFTTCLTPTNTLNLSISGCLLPKPAAAAQRPAA